MIYIFQYTNLKTYILINKAKVCLYEDFHNSSKTYSCVQPLTQKKFSCYKKKNECSGCT